MKNLCTFAAEKERIRLMKNFRKFLFLGIAMVSMAMVSCTKTETRIVEEVGMQTKIIDWDVFAWDYSGKDNNNYYTVYKEFPQLTSQVYKDGEVHIYRVYDYGMQSEVQAPLPAVHHVEYYDDVQGNWNFYTETTDYDFGVGFINLYYTLSDFGYEVENIVPSQMRFRVVLTWPN